MSELTSLPIVHVCSPKEEGKGYKTVGAGPTIATAICSLLVGKNPQLKVRTARATGPMQRKILER